MNDFYRIVSTKFENNTWHFDIEINPKHRIFEGHFPEQPIVPGVCTLQIIRECTESILKQKIVLNQISTCKFLSVVDPLSGTAIDLNITFEITEDNCLNLQANGQFKGADFIKLKAKAEIIK